MSDTTERLTANIVLVGKFNPAIFSPAWVASTGLVNSEALNSAQVSLIHAEVAIFQIGGFSFDVRTERFSVEVASEPLVRALDAALLIFAEMLPHTPLSEMGINYAEHYSLESAERRLKFGRALAPLEPWGSWGQEINGLAGKLISGVIDISLVRTYDPPGSGERRVHVQPSRLIQPATFGVFTMVNDHRILVASKDGDGARPMMQLLQDSFDGSINVARSIIADLRSYAMSLSL